MAISLDSAVDGGGNAGVSSNSWAHTISGAHPLLAVSVHNGIPGSVSSVQWILAASTTNLTYGTSVADTSDDVEVWYVANPPTGSGTVKVTFSTLVSMHTASVSLNGCSASQPDSSTVGTGNPGAPNGTASYTLTTSASNCWWVDHFVQTSPSGAATLSQGTAVYNNGNVASYVGPVASGANTIQYSNVNVGEWIGAVVAFAPFAAAGTSSAVTYKTLLGVGQA